MTALSWKLPQPSLTRARALPLALLSLSRISSLPLLSLLSSTLVIHYRLSQFYLTYLTLLLAPQQNKAESHTSSDTLVSPHNHNVEAQGWCGGGGACLSS